MRRAIAVCASGGLDSCVLIAHLAAKGQEIYPLFIRSDFSWENIELAALKKFIRSLKLKNVRPPADLSFPLKETLSRHWKGNGYKPGFNDGYWANYIPARNVALLSAAAIHASINQIPAIALGSLKGVPYPDAQPRFLRAFETMIKRGVGSKLKIIMPFARLEKKDVIRLGKNLPLARTLSCINPIKGLHCGDSCNKCAERQKAFSLSGMPDPTRYARTPPKVNWAAHKWGK